MKLTIRKQIFNKIKIKIKKLKKIKKLENKDPKVCSPKSKNNKISY